MKVCRLCGMDLGVAAYQAAAPGITSLATLIDVPTEVFVCGHCDHAQSPNLPDIQTFYDTDYRISMASVDHDQLYEVRGDKPVYRTEKQAEVMLDLLSLSHGARLLDFGAAKATTLQRALHSRPDIQGFVFDVSSSYEPLWHDWLEPSNCATHVLPSGWLQTFDAVSCHYVLEHVPNPIDLVLMLQSLLAPGGKLFLSVPDPLANPGDLLVVDHLNHFTPGSLRRVLEEGGLYVETVRTDALNAALVAIARNDPVSARKTLLQTDDSSARLVRLCEYWKSARVSLRQRIDTLGRANIAIFGAGFYGTWVMSILGSGPKPVAFLDNNPHLQGGMHMGVPVFAPKDLEIAANLVIAGVNPRVARRIMEEVVWPAGRSPEIVFLD